MLMKEQIHQEDIITINIHASNSRTPHTCTHPANIRSKRNIPIQFIHPDRMSKYMSQLNHINKQMDSRHIYKTFHPTATELSLEQSRINHLLRGKSKLATKKSEL